MYNFTVHTTYVFSDGELQVTDLDGDAVRYRSELDAGDLARNYVLSLVASAHGKPVIVQTVGATGWRVTSPDGFEETITIHRHA